MPEYWHLLPTDTNYLRSAIADTDVPNKVAQMQEIQARICAALTLGRCVYVHCRAGIGPTEGPAVCPITVDSTTIGPLAYYRQLPLARTRWDHMTYDHSIIRHGNQYA